MLIGPLAAAWLAGCAVQSQPLVSTPRTYEGAGAGALIDKNNRQPRGAAPSGCRQVEERVYQNGQLVQERLHEVC